MTNDCRIDYVEFAAADLEAVKRFYSGAFGWTFTDYGPDYTAFDDGRLNGGFQRAQGCSDSAHGGALVVLLAADLEATLAAVREHGGTIVRDIFTFPGGRRFHFTDPHGNELAVWSDVPAAAP